METLDPFLTPLVAAVAVFLVHFLSHGRFRELSVKIDGLGRELEHLRGEHRDLRSEMGDIRSEMASVRSDVGSVRSDVGSVRSDLTQLALALGVRRPKPNAG